MHKFALLIICLSLYLGNSQESAPEADKATKLANKMLESLGGKSLWQNTRSLHLTEEMRYYQISGPIVQEIWRDLSLPGTKVRITNSTMDRVRAWDAQQGWGVLETGRAYVYDTIRVKAELKSWQRNLFTVCYKIANEDPKLVLRKKNENTLEVLTRTGEPLCEIALDADGAPIKWTATVGDSTESYLYGPLTAFGDYQLPVWWTDMDGHWQFRYTSFEASAQAPETSFLPPKGFTVKE